MVWDFAEIAPVLKRQATLKEQSAGSHQLSSPGRTVPQSAKRSLLTLKNRLSQKPHAMFGLLILPYHDAVPYSYISDFFYVWLKRA